jgi:hypothetical protein
MKIHEVLNGISILITNEENDFISNHGDTVSLSVLDEHQEIVANNLVRKGVYTISNDRRYIIRIDKANERSNLQKS